MDSDFLLALLKPDDWLKGGAERILRTYKGKLWTSIVTLAEVVMVGRAFGLDSERMVSDMLDIVEVSESDKGVALRAAVFISRHGLSTFDAFHAAFAEDGEIISSDGVYDKVGLHRISL